MRAERSALSENHFNLLIGNIEKYCIVSEADKADLFAMAELQSFKRGSFLDRPNSTSRHRNYIVKGAFRSYLIAADGKEHTVQLAIDDHFTSDFYSYITKKPATLYVEALENSLVISLPFEKIEPLITRSISLSEYFRRSTERAFAFSRKRALAAIGMSAEDRYHEMCQQRPEFIQRIALKHIASYLGMTPEFLSKIRAKSNFS